MKTLRVLKDIFLLILFLVPGSINLHAQSKHAKQSQDSTIIRMLELRSFKFVAETANPMSGATRHLTSSYDVRIKADSVISDLPYFGRAYSVNLNSPGGINFTSTNFDYNISPRKKGGWEVVINFNDVSDVRRFTMTVFKNGSASLNVTNNNRQPISFNGRVESSGENL